MQFYIMRSITLMMTILLGCFVVLLSACDSQGISLIQEKGLGKTFLDKYTWFGSGRDKYLQIKLLIENMAVTTHSSFLSTTKNRERPGHKVMDK